MKINYESISRFLTLVLTAATLVVPLVSGAQSANADTTVKPWSAMAVSIDGSKLIAGTWGNGLFTSSDTGTTWIQVTPDTSTATNATLSSDFNSRCYTPFIWTSVAISNDGQTLVAASWGCGLWVSTDGGLSWRQRSTTGSGAYGISNSSKWYSVALSADGTMVYGVNRRYGIEAGYTNSSLELTKLTWSAADSNIGSVDPDITQIDITPDGQLYARNNRLKLYKITVNLDAGTYGEIGYNPNGVTNFCLGAIDVVPTGDSFTVYAAQGGCDHGRISVSRNGGTSWSLLNNAPDKLWLRLSVSSDGRRMIGIGSYDVGEIYLKSTTYSHLWISTDSGNTWSSPDSGTSARHHWSEVKVLPDGSFMAIDGQETPFYDNNFSATSPSWDPVPTITGETYSTSPIPHTGNIWKSNTAGSSWAITDPTFFGGPTGRATLGASETSTTIYDPNRTLGQPKLTFSSAAPGATVNITPTTDPTAGSGAPFMVGAKILDIAIAGVTGNTEICVDGSSTDLMWHYTSGAWVDITTSHTSTQVCGTTSSFSPFAIGAPAPATGDAESAASKAAREARAREIESARSEIKSTLASGKVLSLDQLIKADFAGATSKNLGLINGAIANLSNVEKQDLKQIEKVVLKYATVEKIANHSTVASADLISVGLISENSKNKTSILLELKKLPSSSVDTFEEIQTAVAAVEKKLADRKARLAAILAKKR